MRKHLVAPSILCAAALLTACGEKPQPQTASVNCAAVRLTTDLSAAGALGEFAGDYTNDQVVLTIRQEDYRLLVRSAGSGERELRRVSDWRFEDGCGVTYQFSYPLDHVGRSLEISTPYGSLENYRQIES